MSETKYLHGYSKVEQERLYKQAKFLKAKVFEKIEFTKKSSHILEVGSGVGAQTKILLDRYPKISISCVDRSETQLLTAQKKLKSFSKKVNFFHADATELPFKKSTFDGAFVCWFLEHVADVKAVVSELKRVLKSGSPIFISEVFNSTLALDPPAPAIISYWDKYNKHQIEISGNPHIGLQLGNILKLAGFKKIKLESRVFHLDSTNVKQKNETFLYFEELLLSASEGLKTAGKINVQEIEAVKQEFLELRKNESSVFYFSFIQAKAFA